MCTASDRSPRLRRPPPKGAPTRPCQGGAAPVLKPNPPSAKSRLRSVCRRWQPPGRQSSTDGSSFLIDGAIWLHRKAIGGVGRGSWAYMCDHSWISFDEAAADSHAPYGGDGTMQSDNRETGPIRTTPAGLGRSIQRITKRGRRGRAGRTEASARPSRPLSSLAGSAVVAWECGGGRDRQHHEPVGRLAPIGVACSPRRSPDRSGRMGLYKA